MSNIRWNTQDTHKTPKYTDNGVKFVSVENINDLYNTTKHISESDFAKYKVKPQINDVLMTRIGSIGTCTVIDRDEPLAYYVSLALLRPEQSKLNSRFLKYSIESLHGRKELYKRTLVNAVPIKINKDDIGKITVPVPPIAVQREIVRILDQYSEKMQELKETLEKEKEDREKQYKYYRDKILKFDSGRIEALGNVCNLQAGKSIPTSNIFAEKDSNHNIPCFGANGLRGYVAESNESGNKSLIGRQGALCGNVSYATGSYYATEHAVVVSDEDNNFNPRFLYHLLVHANLNQYKTAGAQPGLSVSRLNKVKVADCKMKLDI